MSAELRLEQYAYFGGRGRAIVRMVDQKWISAEEGIAQLREAIAELDLQQEPQVRRQAEFESQKEPLVAALEGSIEFVEWCKTQEGEQ
jgi:hypothetical protein